MVKPLFALTVAILHKSAKHISRYNNYLTTKNTENKLLQSRQLLQQFSSIQIFSPLHQSFVNTSPEDR